MIIWNVKLGRIGLAERLFREMPEKYLLTWNAMIAGYSENCRAFQNNAVIWYSAKFVNFEQHLLTQNAMIAVKKIGACCQIPKIKEKLQDGEDTKLQLY